MKRTTLQTQRTMNKRIQHKQLQQQFLHLQLSHFDRHVYLWEKQTKGNTGKGTEIELYKHIHISSLSQRQEK